MTYSLYEIPKGWEWSALENVAEIVTGNTPKTSEKENYDDKGIPFIKPPNLNDGVVTETAEKLSAKGAEQARILPVNSVLVSCIGNLGKVGYTRIASAVNQQINAVNFYEDINPKYGFYYSLTLKDWLSSQASATTIPIVNKSKFGKAPIPIAPKNEQSRIVEKLEELLSDLDNGVAELKAAQTKLTQYRQSLLKSAVEGSLTEQWRTKNTVSETGEQLLQRILKERRERWEAEKLAEFEAKGKKPPKNWQAKYPEPVRPDTSELPELPDGWVWASVDQCVSTQKDITDGPFGSNLKTAHYTNSGPRVIRLQNIGDGVFLNDEAHISNSHYEKLTKHAIELGDTVVAMMGEELPRACSIPLGIAPGIVKADCARVRVNSELFEPGLLPYFLNSSPVRTRTKALVKGIGRPRINLSHIRSTAVPIAPIEEQKGILRILIQGEESISQELRGISVNISRADAQRKNILRDAFSGKLVLQDPNDEPASSLLERITAERLNTSKQKKPNIRKKKAAKSVITMDTLEEVLKSKSDWVDAQEAFRECGVTDGTETDRIEELYHELRKLDKAGRLDVERHADYDMIKLRSE